MPHTQPIFSSMLLLLSFSTLPAFATPDVVSTQSKQLSYDTAEVKIAVDQFKLSQFKPMPDLGWTQASVEQFLAQQKMKHQGQFTIGELELVARQLSIRMKQAGLMFSRALIEEQEVIDGQVVITFEDGVLGEVVVMNADRVQPKVLARPFMPYLQTTAVRGELDQALYRLDRLPGVDVFGFFSFTDTPGLSRLNLRVVEETSWKAMLRTDNNGSKAIGRERVHGTLELLNLTGWGDLLKLNVGRSYSQPGFFQGYAQYTFPLGENFQPLNFLISNSNFELGQGFESLEVFGESTLVSADYTHKIGFGRGSLALNSGLALAKARIDSNFFSNLFFRESSVVTLSVSSQFTHLLARNKSQQFGFGVRTGTSEEESINTDANTVVLDTDFTAYSANYRFQLFREVDSHPRMSSLDLNFFGATKVLPNTEQIDFGGQNGIKGLAVGYFSADEGVMLHLSHDTGLWPSNWAGRLALYADAGIGQRKAENTQVSSSPKQRAEFASVGFGYTWSKGPFAISYEFGKVLHANLDNDQATQATLDAFNENQPSRHYLSLSYDLGEH